MSKQESIEHVLRSLPLLPGKEKHISEHAYNLVIAVDALKKWEDGRKPKDVARKLVAIQKKAEKTKNLSDPQKIWKNLVQLRQAVIDLPAEESLYMGNAIQNLHAAIDGDTAGLDRFIENCKTARRLKPVNAGRKNKPITAYITRESVKVYTDLTGKIITVNSKHKGGDDTWSKNDSNFVAMLESIFSVLNPSKKRTSALNYAKKSKK